MRALLCINMERRSVTRYYQHASGSLEKVHAAFEIEKMPPLAQYTEGFERFRKTGHV